MKVHANRRQGWSWTKIELWGDLKNAGVRGIPGGAVALVEDEERDVPQPEDAVAEVIKKDLWRHDEHLGPVDPAAVLLHETSQLDEGRSGQLDDGVAEVLGLVLEVDFLCLVLHLLTERHGGSFGRRCACRHGTTVADAGQLSHWGRP